MDFFIIFAVCKGNPARFSGSLMDFSTFRIFEGFFQRFEDECRKSCKDCFGISETFSRSLGDSLIHFSIFGIFEGFFDGSLKDFWDF